jgi:serine/threonine protein kinase
MGRQTLQLSVRKGDVIGGRYKVVKELGRGGAGAVFRCQMLKRAELDVAIKFLINPGDAKRFKRERKVMAAANSPYVVKLVDGGNHDGFPYIVMEYLHGGSLRDMLDDRGRLPPKEAAWVLVMAIRGLRKASTVHRDLKPDNLLITTGKDGKVRFAIGDTRSASVVKVADFGLAKSRDPANTISPNLTDSRHVMGTPIYMSPEQCRNTREVGVATDIYALGIIFYECVVGKPPFDGESAYDIMTMHCNDAVKWPRGIDQRLQAIMGRCLAKKPEERYRSLLSLERDLAAIAGVGEPEPDRGGWIWWAIGASMLLIILAAWLLHGRVWDVASTWIGRVF